MIGFNVGPINPNQAQNNKEVKKHKRRALHSNSKFPPTPNMPTNDLTPKDYQRFVQSLARDRARNKHPVENLPKIQRRLTGPHKQPSPVLSGQNFGQIYQTLVLGYELAGDVPLQVAQTDCQKSEL